MLRSRHNPKTVRSTLARWQNCKPLPSRPRTGARRAIRAGVARLAGALRDVSRSRTGLRVGRACQTDGATLGRIGVRRAHWRNDHRKNRSRLSEFVGHDTSACAVRLVHAPIHVHVLFDTAPATALTVPARHAGRTRTRSMHAEGTPHQFSENKALRLTARNLRLHVMLDVAPTVELHVPGGQSVRGVAKRERTSGACEQRIPQPREHNCPACRYRCTTSRCCPGRCRRRTAQPLPCGAVRTRNARCRVSISAGATPIFKVAHVRQHVDDPGIEVSPRGHAGDRRPPRGARRARFVQVSHGNGAAGRVAERSIHVRVHTSELPALLLLKPALHWHVVAPASDTLLAGQTWQLPAPTLE